MNCPGCGAGMGKVVEPDITTDRCTACNGVFLDKGELDVLATGMAGDIEFCSQDDDAPSDEFSTRTCPKCAGMAMKKVELLRYTDIIFDYCPKCQGFFLDRGEVEAMNEQLRGISGKEYGEELRTYKNDHLVTVDFVSGVALRTGSPLGAASPVGVTYVRIAVHFKAPMGIGLRVHREGWTVKLAKAFGLYGKEDISMGDRDFDASFVIQATDAAKARRVFCPEARKALLKFIADKPKLVVEPGSLQILDNCIVYSEGPYAGKVQADVVAASPEVVDPLLSIAEMMEAG